MTVPDNPGPITKERIRKCLAAPEPPFTAICRKCRCDLRRSKYDWVNERYWFDERGLAGCPMNGFHEPGKP